MTQATPVSETPAEGAAGGSRRRPRSRDWWTALAVLGTVVSIISVVLIKRSDGGWVEVVQVVAPNESATRLELVIGICNPSQLLPAPRVVETSNEVRISVDVHAPSGDTASCAASATVQLRSPLGKRIVVDGHNGQVNVVFTDVGATSQTPGS